MSGAPFQDEDFEPGDVGLTRRVGPFQVEIVRSVGYFGGVAAAAAFEIVDWPLAVFIGAIPFVKLLNRRNSPAPVRMLSQLFEGMALPVGGNTEGTLRLADAPPEPAAPRRRRTATTRRRTGRAGSAGE